LLRSWFPVVKEVKLRTELERMKFANENLNKYWESKMDCKEEKKILVIRNQKLQTELEETKTNVPVQNLQLVGFSSQPQQAVGVQ
jgi:actin-related protein